MQFRLLSSLKLNGQQPFIHRVAQHWTPHSGRNFLPSATAALGYQKTDRDILGGWSAQASDRYTRLAKQRITVLQLAVADSFSNLAIADPLAESESLENFREYMTGIGISTASITSTIDLLYSCHFASVHRVPIIVSQNLEEMEPEEILIDDTLNQEIPEARPDKRRKLENTRVQQLGNESKKVRSESRPNLQPGYHVSISGKQDTLILHRLGACFRVPGIDYPRFRYLGGEMPPASSFQQVCRLCAKAGPLDRAEGGSSKTQIRRRLNGLKLGLGVLTGVAKQLFHSLFWHRGKGEAKQPSSHHLTAERFVCFPRGKQMNRLSQFLYDGPTYVYGGSSSSQPSSVVCSFPLSSSTSSTRWPRSLSPSSSSRPMMSQRLTSWSPHSSRFYVS